jgi:hypothetical protein
MIKSIFNKNFFFTQIRKNYTNTTDYRIYRNAIVTAEYKDKNKDKNKEKKKDIKNEKYKNYQIYDYIAKPKNN